MLDLIGRGKNCETFAQILGVNTWTYIFPFICLRTFLYIYLEIFSDLIVVQGVSILVKRSYFIDRMITVISLD